MILGLQSRTLEEIDVVQATFAMSSMAVVLMLIEKLGGIDP